MAIAHAETQTGTAGAGATSVATASLGAGGSDSLYVCFVATRSNVDVTSVTGIGLTWTVQDEQCAARAQQRIECWTAYGAGSSGAVTASFASCNGSVISVGRYTGVDSTTPVPTIASYNTLGADGACSGGTDNDDATGSITTANGNNLVVAGFDTRNRTMTDTSGWNVRAADIAGGTGGDLTTMSVEDRIFALPGATTMGGANNLSGTADWCLIGAEAKEAVAAPSGPPANSLMMTGGGV